MRIVIDTNIFISGLFWPGPSHQIFQLAEEGAITIYATQQIVEEFFKVLKRQKFQPLLEQAAMTITEIFEQTLKLITIVSSLYPKIQVISKDPSDNKFLACALSAQVSFIVSGDKHLLNLGKFKNISILTPREFLKKCDID